MAEKYGIDAITSTFHALVDFAVAARQAGADGWSITDTGVLLRDRALMDEAAKALESASQLGDEIGDLSLSEGLRLVMDVMPALGKLTGKGVA